MLGRLSHPVELTPVQGELDRRAEPAEPVLQQVVDRPQSQGVDAGGFVHRPAHHDQRDVRGLLGEDRQGVRCGHRRQRVVADNDLGVVRQRPKELPGRVDDSRPRLVSGPLDLGDDQFGIRREVFSNQQS
jgi:hypothetical protein